MGAAVLGLSLAGFYYYRVSLLETRGFTSGELGPKVFPTLLVVIFSFLSILLLLNGLSRAPEEGNTRLKRGDWTKGALCILFSVGYLVTLFRFGFLISTPIFLSLFVWLYGGRKIKVIVPAALIPTIAIYVIFWKFLKIFLP